MNRLTFRIPRLFLTGMLICLLIASHYGIAQDATSTFAGRVVDESGEPVAGLTVALPTFKTIGRNTGQGPGFVPWQQAVTSDTGYFRIAGIMPEPIALMLRPEHQTPYEIRSADIEGVTYYQGHPDFFGILNFALEPGAVVENVEITVRLRMRIRAQVFLPDGTPLTNTQVALEEHHRKLEGRGRGHSSGGIQLDAEGYFTKYVHRPAIYTLSINYQGLRARSAEIVLHDGERYDELVLRLKEEGTEPIQADEVFPMSEPPENPPAAGAIVPDNGKPQLASISGYVMDTAGNKVADFALGALPVKRYNGMIVPAASFKTAHPSFEPPPSAPALPVTRPARTATTDAMGAFTMADIWPGPLQLIEVSSTEPDAVILSVKIGRLTFHSAPVHPGQPFGKFTFAPPPGEALENVSVTVKRRLNIRGRVVNAEGLPLSNASVHCNIASEENGNRGKRVRTDADGNFTLYLEEPGVYTVSIKHNGLSATAGPVSVKENVESEEFVFQLAGIGRGTMDR